MAEFVLTPFAIKLRRTRTRMGLQQKDVAKLAGIHTVAMSAIETGRIKPGARVAAKIAHVLNMPVDLRDLWPAMPPVGKHAKRVPTPLATTD